MKEEQDKLTAAWKELQGKERNTRERIILTIRKDSTERRSTRRFRTDGENKRRTGEIERRYGNRKFGRY